MDKRLRKIGEPRIETISVNLTDAEVRERHARVSQLRDQQEALKRELAGMKADHKARMTKLIDAEALARNEASTAQRSVDISVQDYITPQNEVVSIRSDNNEVTGRRTATVSELQEELFGGDNDDEGDDDQDGFEKPS